MSGPLDGLKVIELGGMGPVPFAAMMLADMGADVIKIDRVGKGMHYLDTPETRPLDVLCRGRRSVSVNLKHTEGVELIRTMVESSDVLLEGLRPGVTERLGLGPEDCWSRNPRLVYGRMTGWGQTGTRSQTAGHDLNYIALSGALHSIARPGGAPTPPINYVGDFGGGSMFLLWGVMCGLYEARASGRGQVVDAAMVDGAAVLTAANFALVAQGIWDGARGTHMLSGAAPFYDVYQCSDGRWLSIAPNEAEFYAVLRQRLGLDDPLWDAQYDRSQWPERKKLLAAVIASRTRDHWCEVFSGFDACVAPVLEHHELLDNAELAERDVIVQHEGLAQPAPAPRLSRTPGSLRRPPPAVGEHTAEVLREFGADDAVLKGLFEAGVVAGAWGAAP